MDNSPLWVMANAMARGWGGPPAPRGSITTVVLSNGVKLPVHQAIADLVKWLCEETIRRGYNLRAGECWGYAPRKIRGLEKRNDIGAWSNHAWGLAIDLNAPANPMTSNGRLITDMPSWMPELWKSYGFTWGGDYPGKRKDAMHYEWKGTVAQAADMTRRVGGTPVTPPGPGPAPDPGQPIIRRGAKGAAVRSLQEKLNTKGASLVVDGIFGSGTQAAVKEFQSANGLGADGVVGPKTWGALG